MAAASTFPALLLAAVLLLMPVTEAVWLELPPSGTKCVSEEIQPNVVVLADYAIMYESHPTSHPTVAVKVRAPRTLPLSLSPSPSGGACGLIVLVPVFDLDLGRWAAAHSDLRFAYELGRR
jgi:hypothetical protein